jgi:hypothetical protein
MSSIIPFERIEKQIFLIRGHRVMLDSDLAKLYKVETKALNRAVKRNLDRFPQDFMFQLNSEELENLKSQIGTSSWGGRRYVPFVFTEQGVAMLSGVLKSKRAVQVNIAIMRTFVRLREMIVSNKVLAAKLSELENKIENQGTDIKTLFAAIHQLMNPPPEPPKRRIGFHPKD